MSVGNSGDTFWCEGFERFGGTNGNDIATPLGYKYLATQNPTAIVLRDGRVAGKGTQAQGATQPRFDLAIDGTEFYTGFGLWLGSAHADAHAVWSLFETGSVQGLNIRITTGQDLEVRLGASILATADVNLAQGEWHWIEFFALRHASAGAYELRVDGINVASASGIDTINGANAIFARWHYADNALTNQETGFDDIYLLEGSGYDFLGDYYVIGLGPNAAGDSSDWTPSAGANFENVDENPVDDDSTYNESATSTDLDLYNLSALGGAFTIAGIQLNATMRRTDASAFTVDIVAKSDTTTSNDAGHVLGASYETFTRALEVDPDTAVAWTQAGVDALQAGVEVA